MGEVFRAFDARLDRYVALKRIRSGVIDNDRARRRFRQEARTVAQLDHPAIVQIFDLVEGEQEDWIVMELLEGHTLADELRTGPVALGPCLVWAQEIAEALAEAHEKKIIHRDLKPSNVFLTAKGRVKILDFGLAKSISPREHANGDGHPLSVSGTIVGTGSAMSPEQARGLAIDHRSDLFSLGTLIYQMLAGRSPFHADSLADTLSLVLHEVPSPLLDVDGRIPPPLSDLVAQLHEKSPELRPASAKSVADRLCAIAAQVSDSTSDSTSDETTLVCARPRPSRGSSRRQRHPASTADAHATGARHNKYSLAIGLGIGAVLLIGFLWYRDGRESVGVPPAANALADVRNATPHELYQLGLARLARYDQGDNIERAVAAFQRILLVNQESAPAYAGLSQAHWWHYRDRNRDPVFLVQARAAAERAVALDEHLADARVARGLVSFDQGDHDEAAVDFRAALALEPTHAWAHFGQARVFDSQGDTANTEKAFRQAIEHAPDDRRLQDDLGAFYLRVGRYQEAEIAFRRSIELVPDAIHGHRNLASAYYMQGRYDEAAKEMQVALKIEPSPTLYSNLGTLLFAQGLYPDAALAFEKALGLGEAANGYIYWANLADAYRWSASKGDEARKTYSHAIRLIRNDIDRQPGNATLRSRMVLFLAKRGDCTEALAEVETLHTDHVLDASSLFRLAVAHEVCDDRRQALTTLGRALAAGFSEELIRDDPELINLRGDPAFHRLIATLE